MISEEISYWLVGAYSDSKGIDHAPEYIEKGIWVNGFTDRHLDLVRSMKVGDRIAIKSTYTQKHDLPFDNKGLPVSVMAIKAVGTITENMQDGRNLKVEWTQLENPKKWYFYTYRATIWKLSGEDKEFMPDLINFVFKDVPQDIEKFLHDDFWKARYGIAQIDGRNFAWTHFYQEMADAILPYKNNRKGLIEIITRAADRLDNFAVPEDKYLNGKSGPLRDICPFTFFGLFNKGLTDVNRHAIAQELAHELGLQNKVPVEFPGIPVLNNMKAWFFRYESARLPDDIDKLWDLFEKAIALADNETDDSASFESSFDQVLEVYGVKWNITMGLYWIRPWAFVPLDTRSRNLITNELRLVISPSAPGHLPHAKEYLTLNENLSSNFAKKDYLVHSFPQLSLRAWMGSGSSVLPSGGNEIDESETILPASPTLMAPSEPYGLDDILLDGSFLSKNKLEEMMTVLKIKKNLILQGPPGTGKTWLAKRLANALKGNKGPFGLSAMQFHTNLSYEDFVRGWRPIEGGKLELVDGPFLQMVDKANQNPDHSFVFVIEEINRGNPAQVFGELLTLLEADKRTPSEGLQITYRRNVDERFFIPPNLFVVGTMNTADRSLAMLDFAFRRRFAFISLEPTFNDAWSNWLFEKFQIPSAFSKKLGQAIRDLNNTITEDASLGAGFVIGQSFFTPRQGLKVDNSETWALQIIENEIMPTLREYWFDNLEKVKEATESLHQALN